MNAKFIATDIEREILSKAVEGLSTREISAWLLKERGTRMSHTAVARRLRQTRVERGEVVRAVVRERLTPTVISDLDRLAREQRRVERLARRLYKLAIDATDTLSRAKAGENVSPDDLKFAVASAASLAEAALKATDRVAKLASARLHFAGVDATDASAEVAEAERRVRSRVESIAAALRDGAEPPAHFDA